MLREAIDQNPKLTQDEAFRLRRTLARLSREIKFAICSSRSGAQRNRGPAGQGKIAPVRRRNFARSHISTTSEKCGQ